MKQAASVEFDSPLDVFFQIWGCKGFTDKRGSLHKIRQTVTATLNDCREQISECLRLFEAVSV